MALRDYRCGGCGGTFEGLAKTLAAKECPRCGGDAKPVLGTFAFKSYAVDRFSFHEVAPSNEFGQSMTMEEAARTGAVQRFRRGEQADIERKKRADNARRSERNKEAAKREAWAEQRVTIRSAS